MPRSMIEIREILSTYSSGPVVITSAKEALGHAERYRSLAIMLRLAAIGGDAAAAEAWVDNQAV